MMRSNRGGNRLFLQDPKSIYLGPRSYVSSCSPHEEPGEEYILAALEQDLQKKQKALRQQNGKSTFGIDF